MAVIYPKSPVERGEAQIVLRRVSWDLYMKSGDLIGEGGPRRIIFCDGELTISVTSRKHNWYAERLGQMIVALASALRIPWEDAGRATFRCKALNAGLEGVKTYYLAEHAETMIGPRNIDLDVQPPPDLAIEVEASHLVASALTALGSTGRAGSLETGSGRRTVRLLRSLRRRAIYPLAAQSGISDAYARGCPRPDTSGGRDRGVRMAQATRRLDPERHPAAVEGGITNGGHARSPIALRR